MMVFTSLFIAVIVITGLYFLVVRITPWPAVSYLIMIAVGIACLIPGDVHFRYIGIEVAGFGSLLVWVHYQFIRKSKVKGADGGSNR